MWDWIFEAFGIFCHQLPARSWFLGDYQLPLCIRCSAITIGAVSGAAYLFSRGRLPSPVSSMLLCAPMLIELGLVELALASTTNAVRFATGLPFGFAVLVGGLGFLASLPSRGSDSPPG